MRIVTVKPIPPPEPEPTYTIADLTYRELEAIKDALETALTAERWHEGYRKYLAEIYKTLLVKWPVDKR